MYYKITNAEENHHGFQYVDGLNILKEEFIDDANQSCCAGGFYFTDAINIFKFINYGVYLREVTLPIHDPNFKIIKDPEGDKWRANMIILGKCHELFNLNTFKYLIEQGADIHVMDENALGVTVSYGCLDIVKFIVESGADIHADNDFALRMSSFNGDLNIVKFLVEHGADIHVCGEYALIISASYGHFEIVKYLLDLGANIHADNDAPLQWSTQNGHTDVYDFLKSKC